MNRPSKSLTRASEQEARNGPKVLQLMTHPGVGPLTALAFVLIIGTPERSSAGKQIGSYVGTDPVRGLQCWHQRWDTSPSKAALCFVSCWEKQHKPQHVGMRTGDGGMCIWRCVDKGISPSGHVPRLQFAVLDVAERLGIFRVGQVRFERGTAGLRHGVN